VAEFEELVLSVRVDDQATAKLDQLKRTVGDLGGGQAAAGFERLKRQTGEIDEAIKALTETLTKGPAAWTGFVRGAGAAGVAVIGVTYALDEGIKKLNAYARELGALGQMGKTTGFSPGEVESMTRQLKLQNLTIDQAQSIVRGAAGAMADLARQHSTIRTELLKGLRPEERGPMIELLRDLERQTTGASFVNRLQQAGENIYKNLVSARGEQYARERQRSFLRTFGEEYVQLMSKPIEEMTQAERDMWDARTKAGDDYLTQIGKFEQAWKRVADAQKQQWISSPLVLATLGTLAAAMERYAGALERAEQAKQKLGAGPEAFRELQRGAPWYQQRQANPPPGAAWLGGVWDWLKSGFGGENATPQFFAGPGAAAGGGRFRPDMNWANALSGEPSTNIEDRRQLSEDNTSALELNTEELKRLNDFFLGTRVGAGAPSGAFGFLGGAPGGRAGIGGGIGGGGELGGGAPYGSSVRPGAGAGQTAAGTTTAMPQLAWPSPAAGNIVPPNWGIPGGGIGGGAVSPWASTIAPGAGGAYEGKPVAVPPGWGPGGGGQPWPQGGAPTTSGGAPPSGTTSATWFYTGGAYRRGPGAPSWPDPSGAREGPPASGLPHTTPGIATPGRAGLGDYYKVTLPDGRVVYTTKADIGPGAGPQRRGIGLDVNAPLADILYPGGPTTFPTHGFRVERVGPKLPEGATLNVPTQQGTRQGDPRVMTAGEAGITPKFDPGGKNWQQLDATFVQSLNSAYDAMTPEQRESFKLSSGYRSVAEQAEIYRRSQGGRLFAAAPPGRSRHGEGTAVDIPRGPALTFLQQRGREFGLTGILGGLRGRDPVHIQAIAGRQPYSGSVAAADATAAVPYLAEHRALLDRAMGRQMDAKVEGTGQLTVDVNAPAGTRVNAEGGGLFKRTEVNRRVMMEEAQSGPSTPRAAGGTGGIDEE
jgi:D-alanyl-D-alanine carboxypeptidase